MRLKVMDLFCGTGGFSKGFEQSGAFEVVFGVDLLRSSVETFRSNHRDAWALAADIHTVRRSEIAARLGVQRGEVDVIVGGPPCQGFSSIRPFRSADEDDPRNTLFEEFASFVNFFRPRYLVFENVVGLATHRNGATLAAIVETFERLGYDVDWRILNAAHFGVPQKRERLILIGAEAGLPLRFPAPTHSGDFRTIGYGDSGRLLRPDPEGSFFAGRLPSAVTVKDAIDDLPAIASGEEALKYDRDPRTAYQANMRNRSGSLTLHASTRHTDRMLEIIRHAGTSIRSLPAGMVTSGFSSCYSRLAGDEPATTITVNFVHPASNRCIHPTLDRALTPREGARLQSFADDFVFAGTRTEIVKQIGNAVPPLLGQAVAVPIAAALAPSLLATA